MPRTKFAPAYSYGSVSSFSAEGVEAYEKFKETAEDEYQEVIDARRKKELEREEKLKKEIEESNSDRMQKYKHFQDEAKDENELKRIRNYIAFVMSYTYITVKCVRKTTQTPYNDAPICGTFYKAKTDPETQVGADFKHLFLNVLKHKYPPKIYTINEPRKCPRCYKRLTEGVPPLSFEVPLEIVTREDVMERGILPHLRISELGDKENYRKFREELEPYQEMTDITLPMYDLPHKYAFLDVHMPS